MRKAKIDLTARKPVIFIAYQVAELALADAMHELFTSWGYDPFHCRTEGRDAEQYRKDLRQRLVASDVVVFILSREFQWSGYCQAEAGTVMALEMPFVAVIVPPVTPLAVRDIAPVMEGMDVISLTEPTFITHLENELSARVSEAIERRNALAKRFRIRGTPQPQVSTLVNSGTAEVVNHRLAAAIDAVTQRYRYRQPRKTLQMRWDSLRDDGCQESIIHNLSASIKSANPVTTVDLAGVSLKYSLSLIDRSLEVISGERFRSATGKLLRLRLVHMHADSHILRALGDDADLKAIRANFVTNWPTLIEKWGSICKQANVSLELPLVREIDYIPPVIGMLIDNTILFRGQCTLGQIGLGKPPSFRLQAGENEYDMWVCDHQTESSSPAYVARAAFRDSFAAYLENQFNCGAAVVVASSVWLGRIAEHLYPSSGEPIEVTLVSATAVKFQQLVRHALAIDAKVRVVFHASERSRQRVVSQVRERYVKELGECARSMAIVTFSHPPTFRGVVVGSYLLKDP